MEKNQKEKSKSSQSEEINISSNKENKENKTTNKNLEPQEKKNYINFHYFQISVGILCTYIYIMISLILSVINRIIFINYRFKFNFTFLLMQQIATLIIFSILSKYNKLFIKLTGVISFKDFYQHKYIYLLFSMVFSLHHMVNFKSKQLTENVNMYISLRKLIPIKTLIFDYIFEDKKPKISSLLSAPCVTLGTILIGMDTFSRDYAGFIMVFISNFFTIMMNKFSEKFKKITGVSNLKLLVYNSYISNLVLFVAILVSKEYQGHLKYFNFSSNEKEKFGIEGSYTGLAWYLFWSCFLVVILNSTHFISNERNSSLVTELFNRSKEIFITTFFYFYDRKKNYLTHKMILGTIISLVGAFIIVFDSTKYNIIFGVQKNDKNDKSKEKGIELKDLEEEILTETKNENEKADNVDKKNNENNVDNEEGLERK